MARPLYKYGYLCGHYRENLEHRSSAKEMSRLLDCFKLYELGCIRSLPVNLVKFFVIYKSSFGWLKVSFH